MDDFTQKYQNGDFQKNYNDYIEEQEIGQVQEDSEPPKNVVPQQNNIDNNKIIPNPEGSYLPIDNQPEEQKENESNNNMEIEPSENNTQINGDNNENNELENMVLLSMNENENANGDDKLNFYPELSKVEVNKTTSSYQYTENQPTENQHTENNEAPPQPLRVIHVGEKSTEVSMKKD